MDQFLTNVLEYFKRIAEALERIAEKETTTPPVEQPTPVEPTPTEPEPVEPEPTPVEPETPTDSYPTLPEGFIKPADLELMSDGWRKGNLVLPTWSGGNPALVDFRDNGSAILTARNINGTWNTGWMQIFRPQNGQGTFEAIFSVDNPNGVAAFFTYADDGTEDDFELVRRPDGTLAWQLNVHMFTTDRKRRNPTKIIFVPVTKEELAKPHKYTIVHSAESVRFLIDDVEVGKYTPADMPAGTPWSTTSKLETFLGTWRHTGWSGWTTADYANGNQVTVYGVKVPNLPA